MVDRLVISADENTYFKEYINIVYAAWKKFFPEIEVSLAFVSDRDPDDTIFKKLRKYMDVEVYPIVAGVPIENQAKMARHFLAGKYDKDVITIEDIDTIPLQRDFFEDKFSARKEGTILFVGREVYDNTPDKGKCPISTMTAESFLFKKCFNPTNLSYEDFISSFIGSSKFDSKENIAGPPSGFSDESVLRSLLSESDVPTTEKKRSVNIAQDWIDRSWWHVDSSRLKSGNYVTCNFLRPFSKNYQHMREVVEFIYGQDKEKGDVIFGLEQ